MSKDIKVVISPPFGHYIKFLPWATPIIGTMTLNRRPGIIKNILKTFRPDFHRKGWTNKMSLVNTGITSKMPLNPDYIYSITAFNDNDWDELYELIPSNITVEINMSCPNTDDICLHKDVLTKFNEKFVTIVKLSSNNFYETLDQVNFAYSCGVRFFHVGNTVKVKEGGLSGREIQKVSLQIIRYIKRNIPDSMVIGGGGIYSAKDVIAYREAGADIFSLATVFMMPWRVPEIYREIFKDV